MSFFYGTQLRLKETETFAAVEDLQYIHNPHRRLTKDFPSCARRNAPSRECHGTSGQLAELAENTLLPVSDEKTIFHVTDSLPDRFGHLLALVFQSRKKTPDGAKNIFYGDIAKSPIFLRCRKKIISGRKNKYLWVPISTWLFLGHRLFLGTWLSLGHTHPRIFRSQQPYI